MRRIWILFISIIVFSSCKHDIETELPGKWNVTTMHYPEFDKLTGKLLKNENVESADITSQFVQGDFFRFFKDKTFTCLSLGSHFSYGNWTFDKSSNTILLNSKSADSSKSDSIDLKIVKFKLPSLVIRRKVGGKPESITDLQNAATEENHSIFSDSAGVIVELTLKKIQEKTDDNNDYTSLANNMWRIKPDSAETYAQILKRVRESLNFSIMYLTNWMNSKENSVPLKPIALPIFIASNGIQLDRADEMDYRWKQIFYNEDDALTGYRIIKAAMSDVKVPDKERVKLAIDLLKQIMENVR
jgi:hypothetical protein